MGREAHSHPRSPYFIGDELMIAEAAASSGFRYPVTVGEDPLRNVLWCSAC